MWCRVKTLILFSSHSSSLWRDLQHFNRWHCGPHFQWVASVSIYIYIWQNSLNLRQFLCFDSFLIYLFFLAPTWGCWVGNFVNNHAQQTHQREQQAATTSDSWKVNVWDKNITFFSQHPFLLIRGAAQTISQTQNGTFLPFTSQYTDSPAFWKIMTSH